MGGAVVEGDRARAEWRVASSSIQVPGALDVGAHFSRRRISSSSGPYWFAQVTTPRR